jgi:putative phosphoesterase
MVLTLRGGSRAAKQRSPSVRIGIVSDTHSRQHTVRKVLELLREQGVECVLHCGDIEDADTVRLFEAFPTHYSFGNCDGDRPELRQAMAESGAVLHEPFGHLELAGRKIAWLHGDDKRLFQDVERSGHFDYLFYGHTHHPEQHRSGPTLVVNPGALYRARVKTFVVLDLANGKLESIPVV